MSDMTSSGIIPCPAGRIKSASHLIIYKSTAMKKIKFSGIIVALLVMAVSCKKTDVVTTAPKVTSGIYSLNQGNYGSNNTTITYYDFSTTLATTDYYKNVNGFGLGDTGSDFIIYGG